MSIDRVAGCQRRFCTLSANRERKENRQEKCMTPNKKGRERKLKRKKGGRGRKKEREGGGEYIKWKGKEINEAKAHFMQDDLRFLKWNPLIKESKNSMILW